MQLAMLKDSKKSIYLRNSASSFYTRDDRETQAAGREKFCMTRFPILVQFEYHPESFKAETMAEYLRVVINDDPTVPGLRIPTRFTPNNGSFKPPEPRLDADACRVLVVLLADDQLAASARTGRNNLTWGDYAVNLWDLCKADPNHWFLPVSLDKYACPIDNRFAGLSFLQAFEKSDGKDRKKFVARRMLHRLIQMLLPVAPSIFLSYAKADIGKQPKGAVNSLLDYFKPDQLENAWFDSGDITPGSRFAEEIEKGIKRSTFLAVLTDTYSSRPWCCQEVLLAKRHRRPFVVVDALREGEIRRFPYAGNAPVIRWRDSSQDVVDLLHRETLRHAYAKEMLRKHAQPKDDVFPVSPELVTVMCCNKMNPAERHGEAKPILYLDPPLGKEELKVLSRAGVTVETPLERYARDHDLRAHKLLVALSISEAKDIQRFGLRSSHLDDVLLEVSRYLLLAGVRLAYGGCLGSSGYTVQLASLLYDQTIDQFRREPVPGIARPAELVLYLAWPIAANPASVARLGALVEVIRCKRPLGLNETVDPSFVERPLVDIPLETVQQRFAWAQGLTTMRECQTKDIKARVVAGGCLGPSGNGYRGRMPGVLEEVLLTVRAGLPIYLIGAFGGCARLVIDALEGKAREELQWEYQRRNSHSEELRKTYQEQGVVWDNYDAIAAELKAQGLSGLKNGLTVDENRELANTRSGERIVELVIRGLQQCRPLKPTEDQE